MKKLMIIFMGMIVCAVALAYSGGDGSTLNPYRISNLSDFQKLCNTPTDWKRAFILRANINLQGITYTQSPIAPNTGSSSSFQGTQFTGIFNGNGYIISNLTINALNKYHIGLFGYIGSTGKVFNLGVNNVNVSGIANVGGLAGYNRGVITSCYTAGSSLGGLSNSSSIGGLIGYNAGSISSCYSSSNISGDIGGSRDLGGLVGLNVGNISFCYATGSVIGANRNSIGGLIGSNSGMVTSCFWDKESSIESGSDGGKGLNTTQMKSMSVFQNAGWVNKGWVIDDGMDYPRLAWENTEGIPIPLPDPIPLAGSGTSNDPYLILDEQDFELLSWRIDVLNKHIALTADLDMNGISIYPIGDLGPFTGTFDGYGHIISNTAFGLSNNRFMGLFARVGGGGRISNLGVEGVNVSGLKNVGGLAGYNQGIISSCYTTGAISGGEYTSYNIGGIVGYNTGSISSCYSSTEISGLSFAYRVGGLVGYNNGIISLSYANPVIAGSFSSSGGLVGYSTGSSYISSCYADTSITGSDTVGGLVGFKGGTVLSCYASGSVTASSSGHVGGLFGYHISGSTSNCYAACLVSGNNNVGGLIGNYGTGTFTACFWDIEASNQTEGVGTDFVLGVTGKTTSEMQTPSTFTSAGWDFTNTWWMAEGDYPRLHSLPGPFILSVETNPSFINTISPPVGQINVSGTIGISAQRFIDCPDVYEFDYWIGDVKNPDSAQTTVFLDQDKTITAVFKDARACGDECRPYPPMDFNEDCRVDLADFAMFASHWMECTAPECE